MGEYSKMWVAVIGAMLTTVQTAIPMPPVWHGVVAVLIAGLTAVGVRQIENKPLDAR